LLAEEGGLAGRWLGRYRLEEPVGAGGFGTVYRATDAELGTRRAVKVLREGLAELPEFRGRFLREARVAATLEHPNVVRVREYGVEHGLQYLVMDFVEAATLADHLVSLAPRQRLADPLVRRAVRDVASALDHAHGLGVVHLDLKPANVLLRRDDGRALLTDFGIARTRPDADATMTGRTLGTYAYMSPEQCRGDAPLTPRSDVYSLAALLHEVATGRPPYGHGLPAVAGHLGGAPPAAREADPGLPAELDAVLRRGLAADPAERQGSAGELAAGFLEATAGPVPATASPVPAAGRRPARRAPGRRGARGLPVALAAATGLSVAAGAVVLGVALPRGSPAPDRALTAVAGAATAVPAPSATAAVSPSPPPSPTTARDVAARRAPAAAAPSAPPAPSPPAARLSWPRYAYDLGTQSEAVHAIQLLLVARGLDVGPSGPDGVYGAMTQNAVQQFQRQSSLPTDGVVDGPTWEKLVVAVDPGRRGVEVEAMQRLLNVRGARLAVDGDFGGATQTAVVRLQQANHLPATGRADVATWCAAAGGTVQPPS
jgi:serine/threonine-protein kinase